MGKTQQKAPVKPELRPVDERGVVRLGPGGPARPVAPKPPRPAISGTRRDRGMGPGPGPRPVPGRQGPKTAPAKPRVAPKGKYAK